nr:MAG TPA: hypothetical protein [Caudoviricetes sp.]
MSYYDSVKKIKRAGYWTTHKIPNTERGLIPSSLFLLKQNKKTAHYLMEVIPLFKIR